MSAKVHQLYGLRPDGLAAFERAASIVDAGIQPAWSVAIVETIVGGAVAYHAECRHCDWKSPRYDGKRGNTTAIRLAKEHGALHAEGKA